MAEADIATNLIGWAQTPHGFFVDPRQAGYTMNFLAEKCWGLRLRCARCGHAASLTVGDLQSRFPGGVTVGALATRLVCRVEGCGSNQGLVEFCQDHAACGRRDMAAYLAKT